MENIQPRYCFSIATLESPVPWIKIWYGLQSLSDTGCILQGICRQPHFPMPVPRWLNPEQPLSGRVNVVWWWVSATYLVWRQERACLSVPLPADMPRICSSAALNALWKVECWACLAVSLDTALDSLKRFPICAKEERVLAGTIRSGSKQTWQKGFQALLEFSYLVTGGTIHSFFMRYPFFQWL